MSLRIALAGFALLISFSPGALGDDKQVPTVIHTDPGAPIPQQDKKEREKTAASSAVKCEGADQVTDDSTTPLEGLPFRTKFERQQALANSDQNGMPAPVFKKGEKVRSRFFIEIDKEKGEVKLLSEDVGDTRHADEFIFKGDVEKYRCLEGIPLEGSVEITGDGKYWVSNMFQYPAKIIALRRIGKTNPDNAWLSGAKSGDVVTVEGTVAEIPKGRDGSVMIKTSDGRTIPVELFSGLPQYEKSISPKIDTASVGRKPMEVGDKVRINGFVTKEGGIGCHWCRSSYLLDPNESRLKVFSQLKKQNETSFGDIQQALKKGDFKAVRQAAAGIVKREPTAAETKRLNEFFSRVPDSECPLKLDRYYTDSVNKQFGRDLDAMSSKEFVQFAKDFSAGKIKSTGGGDETYIFRLLEDSGWAKQNRREYIEMQKTAVRTRVKQLDGLLSQGKEDQFSWNDQYTSGQTVNSLAYQLNADNANADDKAFVEELQNFVRKENVGRHFDSYYVGLLAQRISQKPTKD